VMTVLVTGDGVFDLVEDVRHAEWGVGVELL